MLTSAVVAALAMTACSSSSSTSSAALTSAAVQQECTNIADVLSDGPDPNSDPVGYAEAQILPLRQLSIADPTLHKAVLQLAAAYQAFSSDNGDAATTSAAVKVSAAEGEIDALCPKGVGDQLLPGQAVP